MKVLSLFDGMSCGQIALNKLGISVEDYLQVRLISMQFRSLRKTSQLQSTLEM